MTPDSLIAPMDRRRTLRCMGWAGTGALFTLSGGIAHSRMLEAGAGAKGEPAPFSFVQISDTHIGFAKPANPDPLASLRQTIARIKALPQRPDFIVHTGDVTHLATPAQFDMAQQLLSEIGLPVFAVPGEHDMVDGADPRAFNARFGKDIRGDGWFSFDMRGVHFVGLVNSAMLGASGQGTLGRAQLDWLKTDLAGLSSSTPVVLMSHFPLWPLYPDWGWGTADAAEAFALLRRFGSITSLNGHIHQIQRKVEGNLMFHAARSTAYPQPAPGQGAGPGPLVVPASDLPAHIGMTSLSLTMLDAPIAVTDLTLG
ncbi:metallophosphoesterase family protein [Novosphingobium sp. KACC 22771]|uniref:metallophosphoesterase family protein n=1 Tax=Novosphingobium sp. KACC 22771 TaxID=3025670 RepID=UPI00236534F7|nr:metallophosphoesterase [Novosphingobium sp. KACC 22771]WDF70900.1 metallophosphoesterase [Novosphingobium sp. KACC 22771]